jgi:large subunit ribosomal protein L17
MKHRKGFNRLARKPAHRLSLYRHVATALFLHERVRTTVVKAKAIRPVVERMITRARTDSMHNRRMLARDIQDKSILAKLFTDIAPRFEGRPGGYTRILRVGKRGGDTTDMAILELVVRKETKKKPRKAADKKEGKEKEPVAEAQAVEATEKA